MSKRDMRSAARLAGVQALYEMEMSGKSVVESVAEFEAHWMGREVDDVAFKPAEEGFFRDLVGGVVQDQVLIDRKIDGALQTGWPLRRIEAVLRAILRAGCYELLRRRDVPAKVVISEYVDVTHAFYEGEEPGLVNAVLDVLARDLRGDELAKRVS
jgi:N utilization substance protein B